MSSFDKLKGSVCSAIGRSRADLPRSPLGLRRARAMTATQAAPYPRLVAFDLDATLWYAAASVWKSTMLSMPGPTPPPLPYFPSIPGCQRCTCYRGHHSGLTPTTLSVCWIEEASRWNSWAPRGRSWQSWPPSPSGRTRRSVTWGGRAGTQSPPSVLDSEVTPPWCDCMVLHTFQR